MPLAIDRAQYAAAPRIGIDTGATLLEQLVDVAKDDESEVISASVTKLRKVLGRARGAKAQGVRAAAKSSAAGDLELDRKADRSVKAIKLRLEPWTLLADEEQEKAQRAKEHLRLLFPNGLQFTQASFAVQDAEMRRLLAEIKQPALAKSLEQLVGAEFIAAFKAVAKPYAEMVKAMGRAVDEEEDQRIIVAAMQTAIVQHASRVLGELEDDDPRSVQRVRGLLAPIDNIRDRTARGGGGGAGREDGSSGEGGSGGGAAPG